MHTGADLGQFEAVSIHSAPSAAVNVETVGGANGSVTGERQSVNSFVRETGSGAAHHRPLAHETVAGDNDVLQAGGDVLYVQRAVVGGVKRGGGHAQVQDVCVLQNAVRDDECARERRIVRRAQDHGVAAGLHDCAQTAAVVTDGTIVGISRSILHVNEQRAVIGCDNGNGGRVGPRQPVRARAFHVHRGSD